MSCLDVRYELYSPEISSFRVKQFSVAVEESVSQALSRALQRMDIDAGSLLAQPQLMRTIAPSTWQSNKRVRLPRRTPSRFYLKHGFCAEVWQAANSMHPTVFNEEFIQPDNPPW